MAGCWWVAGAHDAGVSRSGAFLVGWCQPLDRCSTPRPLLQDDTPPASPEREGPPEGSPDEQIVSVSFCLVFGGMVTGAYDAGVSCFGRDASETFF